jgi:conjugal transfer pilus assembly protein TraF
MSPAFAGTAGGKFSYDDSRRGWWWYEEEPVKNKDKNEKQEEKKEAKPARVLPSLKDYTTEQLWNMHPDDFQPLAKEFLKKAVQTPTIETVREFYIMLDMARMKSHVFQNVAGAVWQMYPELSLNADLPSATAGRVAQIKMTNKETISKIKASSRDFALVYFYAENCEFCRVQNEVLEYFIDKYGWEVKRVEIHEHPELAERFDVKITPYVILIYRESKDQFPVSIGVSSLDEMEDRIYRGIRLLSGEISPEAYSMYEFQRGGKLDPSIYMNSATEGDR